jgi:hypothetical protein
MANPPEALDAHGEVGVEPEAKLTDEQELELWMLRRHLTEHLDSVVRDHVEEETRALRRDAEEEPVFNVAYLPRGAVSRLLRANVADLLETHEHIVVTGARGSGKSTLIAHLALRLATLRLQGTPGWVPFPVPVRLLLLQDPFRLDEESIVKLSPLAGLPVLKRLLEKERALVLIDGLDEAGDRTTALAQSILDFAAAHPKNRILVTSRPRPSGLPGLMRVDLPGFVQARMLPPPHRPLYAAHHFLARRMPERRAALLGARVDALLHAWDADRLPPGSLLGRFDLESRRILLGSLAMWLHMEHGVEAVASTLALWLDHELLKCLYQDGEGRLLLIEPPEEIVSPEGERSDEEEVRAKNQAIYDDLVRQQQFEVATRVVDDAAPSPSLEGLAPIADVAGMGKRLVEEMTQHPGLLMAGAPGTLRFADFAFQEYLAAVWVMRARGGMIIDDVLEDRWWEEVLVHMAAVRTSAAVALIDYLLSLRSSAPGVFLAARCVEVAPGVPASMKRAVARRVAGLVPPENVINVDHLIQVGEVAGPAVVAALDGASDEKRGLMACVLGNLRYPAGHAALLRMLSDQGRVGSSVPSACDELNYGLGRRNRTVGNVALVALYNAALHFPAGRKAFETALSKAPVENLKSLFAETDTSLTHILKDPDLSAHDRDLRFSLRDSIAAALQAHSAPRRRVVRPLRRGFGKAEDPPPEEPSGD